MFKRNHDIFLTPNTIFQWWAYLETCFETSIHDYLIANSVYNYKLPFFPSLRIFAELPARQNVKMDHSFSIVSLQYIQRLLFNGLTYLPLLGKEAKCWAISWEIYPQMELLLRPNAQNVYSFFPPHLFSSSPSVCLKCIFTLTITTRPFLFSPIWSR